MNHVTPRSMWMVACWQTEPDARFDMPVPDVYLGPYTNYQVERIAASLTCPHRIYPLQVTVPDWARTSE